MKLNSVKVKVIDNFHGVRVSDPYRWLEDMDSADTKEWVHQQNESTRSYLDNDDGRNKVKNRLTKLTNYKKYSTPKKEGNYYYFYKNEGLQDQPVYCRSKTLDGTDFEIIIDSSEYSKEGTAAITNITFNQQGTKLVYAISYNGSDWQELRIKDLNTLEDYPELLSWCKFTAIAWTKDGRGFYYNRYPAQADGTFSDASHSNQVYWHQLGTMQEEDTVIYKNKDNKELSFVPAISDDNKYLILTVHNGTEPKSDIFYRSIASDEPFRSLFHERRYDNAFLGNKGDTFYIYTNHDAPKGKVVAVDIHQPAQEHWREIISEQADTMSFVDIINDHFVVCYLNNACHMVSIYDLKGSFKRKLPLPKYISIADISGKRNDPEMFLSYTSFLQPATIHLYNMENDELKMILSKDEAEEMNSEYVTKQVYFRSKDGTEVPMFITHKKGIKKTGDHPVLLYGYGGYNISLTPSYSPSQKLWLEAGGIYAVTKYTGWRSSGKKWHLAGILDKKQNSFDDFIAAAEWLIHDNYTSPERLAIMGASNGGLLVASCVIQRPELFGAGISLVPVTDMLRFHHFTVGILDN